MFTTEMFPSREEILKSIYKTTWKTENEKVKKFSFQLLFLCVLHFDYLHLMWFRTITLWDVFHLSHLFFICCCSSLLLDWLFCLVCTTGFYFLMFALNLQYSVPLINRAYLQVIKYKSIRTLQQLTSKILPCILWFIVIIHFTFVYYIPHIQCYYFCLDI